MNLFWFDFLISLNNTKKKLSFRKKKLNQIVAFKCLISSFCLVIFYWYEDVEVEDHSHKINSSYFTFILESRLFNQRRWFLFSLLAMRQFHFFFFSFSDGHFLFFIMSFVWLNVGFWIRRSGWQFEIYMVCQQLRNVVCLWLLGVLKGMIVGAHRCWSGGKQRCIDQNE